ncbi:MAG: alpha/beta fold hydrolase [Deltaproteobacteria bacterium]|nr:alpha/beta fold hydrolase [Deltaproteobacteria bacterium]
MSGSAEPVIESRDVPTKVGNLRVEVRGTGPAVLCWPSLYCDARALDPLVEALAVDHRVVVVNGPGHGGSGSSPGLFSLDDCAFAALSVLDVLGIRDAVWIGAAWGGQIGVAAARRHPERLTGLVILNAPMAPWSGSRLVLTRLTYALLTVFGPCSFLAPVIAGAMIAQNASDRPQLVATVADRLRRCEKRAFLLAARSAMFERGDVTPLLSEVRVPTLYFAGAEDSLLPVAQARAEASRIPRCRFVVVERSSHQSVLEAPEQVIPAVREALADWRR